MAALLNRHQRYRYRSNFAGITGSVVLVHRILRAPLYRAGFRLQPSSYGFTRVFQRFRFRHALRMTAKQSRATHRVSAPGIGQHHVKSQSWRRLTC